MSSIRRAQPARILPLLIAAAGAIVLVVQWAQARMFWLDEEMIAINIRERSFLDLMGSLSLGQAAPHGWLAFERLMFVAAGGGELALRFLPMAYGVATLVTAVWIGRRWMGPAGATALAFLCAAGQWLSFHALELKHYSADAFFGLFLPALAVWAVEPQHDGIRRRRIVVWWAVAIVAQWSANGAIFVAPACVLAMLVAAWRHGRWRSAVTVAAPGVLWLAAFSANYFLVLAPIRTSDFLQSYWRDAFPPAGSGIAGSVRWLADRVVPLAIKPGGSGFGLALWATAIVGWLAAPGYPIAWRIAFTLIPMSAFVWAGAHLVPMFERLSLWMIPALYVGVAMAADATAVVLIDARRRRSGIRAAIGIAAAGFLIAMGLDVYTRGRTYMQIGPYPANHELDDRGAVRWLARQRQPGDVWVTTHNALPAVWWYAGDGDVGPAFETMLQTDPADCGDDEIGARLRAAGATRVLAYLGFGHDVPAEFDDALVGRLGSLGAISGYRMFGENGHALVVDLRGKPTGPVTLEALTNPSRTTTPATVSVSGCMTIEPASRW